VRNEDLEAVGTQRAGALVDERAFVRREERTGEVDLQGADATACNLTVMPPSPALSSGVIPEHWPNQR